MVVANQEIKRRAVCLSVCVCGGELSRSLGGFSWKLISKVGRSPGAPAHLPLFLWNTSKSPASQPDGQTDSQAGRPVSDQTGQQMFEKCRMVIACSGRRRLVCSCDLVN